MLNKGPEPKNISKRHYRKEDCLRGAWLENVNNLGHSPKPQDLGV